jgi:HEAT repeat protein
MMRLAIFFTLLLPSALLAQASKSEESDATTKALVSLLTKQLKDRDPKKRSDAAKELGALGAKAREAARPLCEACIDASSRVSVASIDALEKIRPDLHKHLVTILVDSNTTKHEQAFNALAQLKDEANTVTPILLAYLGRASIANHVYSGPPITCMNCLDAVASDDPTILTPLTRLARQHPGTPLAAHCIYSLSRLGEAQPDLRKKVYPTLTAALATNCRLEAIRGLARLGPDAKDALPLLQKLRFDSEEAVRNAAVAAIEKIQGS